MTLDEIHRRLPPNKKHLTKNLHTGFRRDKRTNLNRTVCPLPHRIATFKVTEVDGKPRFKHNGTVLPADFSITCYLGNWYPHIFVVRRGVFIDHTMVRTIGTHASFEAWHLFDHLPNPCANGRGYDGYTHDVHAGSFEPGDKVVFVTTPDPYDWRHLEPIIIMESWRGPKARAARRAQKKRWLRRTARMLTR